MSVCPHCASLDSEVIDTRRVDETVRRRRRCLRCRKRWTTYELNVVRAKQINAQFQELLRVVTEYTDAIRAELFGGTRLVVIKNVEGAHADSDGDPGGVGEDAAGPHD